LRGEGIIQQFQKFHFGTSTLRRDRFVPILLRALYTTSVATGITICTRLNAQISQVIRFQPDGRIAQLVEQRTENPCVGGSIPPPATTVF
jgi:hypothetical protein